MKTPPDLRGYPVVCIVVGPNQRRVFRVHRLVMLAFVGECPQGHEVRHLDGDSSNAALANLAYGTRSENARDTVRHGRAGRGLRKLTADDVLVILDMIAMEAPQMAIAEHFGVTQSTISSIACGRSWKSVTLAAAVSA